MGTLLQDIRYGFRMLVRNPGFTVVAVLTLALGIGACTAILSVVNAVLLRPLPYADPERLVAIDERNLKGAQDVRYGDGLGVSTRVFLALQEQSRSFEEVAFSRYGRLHLTGGEFPEMVNVSCVSANLFRVLGAKPLIGRTFSPGEDQPGNSDVAVISHGLWQRRFGGDPNIVGKTISFNDFNVRSMEVKDEFCTIVGIMPPRFLPCRTIGKSEMWLPQVFEPDELDDRGSRFLLAVGRLKGGVKLTQAQAEADLLMQRLGKPPPPPWLPDADEDWTIQIQPLRETFVGGVQQSLLMLLGAVSFVLLIACSNVGNMLLARAASRQKEVAVRASLGAGRWRVIRQLLTESILLAFLGAALGMLLTYWSIGLLKPLIPSTYHQALEIGMDTRMFGFTLFMLIATGVVCGLAPAWRLSRTNLTEALKEGGSGSSGGSGRKPLLSLLVVSQVALALVLLIGAGLLIQTVVRLLRVDPGYKPHNLMGFGVTLSKERYPEFHQRIAFNEQLLERIKSLPGVLSVGVMAGSYSGACSVGTYDYIRTMGIPLLQGRYLTNEDITGGDNNIIINEAAAHQFWPGENPIGKRISRLTYGIDCLFTVVGVVKNIRLLSYTDEAGPQFYYPYRRLEKMNVELSLAIESHTPDFVVRSTMDPLSLIKAINREVAALDEYAPVVGLRNFEGYLFESIAKQRIYMQFLTFFAIMGLILTAIGIYGVISYSVARRTHEIGIRMALGANSSDVLKGVLGQGLKLTVVGVAIGVAGALALMRVLSSFLYGVTPTDPMTFVAVCVLLTAVGLIACYIPARRAARIDPMVALRYE